MKKYSVVALAVGANSNRIFYAKDIVNEDAFDTGRADELVKQGFLQPYDEVVITLDKDDLVNNPDLIGEGLNVGDEVTIPVTEPGPNVEPSVENDLSKLVGEASGSDVVNEDESKAEGKASKPKK